jgi:hypothetical protein
MYLNSNDDISPLTYNIQNKKVELLAIEAGVLVKHQATTKYR